MTRTKDIARRRRAEAVTAEQADKWADDAAITIATVQTPEDAERLLAKVTASAQAVALAKLGEKRVREWSGLKLKAERRYGELLPPKAKGGRPSKKTLSGGKSNEQNMVEHKARKVATIPQEDFDEYVQEAPAPSRAGLLREKGPPTQARAKQKGEDDKPLWKDERVIAWVGKAMKAKLDRDATVAASKNGERGWPIPGTHLPQNAYDRARAIVEDRHARGGRPTWNGKSADKRRRELRERKDGGGFNQLVRLQMEVNKLWSVLMDWDVVEDCELDLAGMGRIDILHDDLISLGEWHDRALVAVQSRLLDADVRRKIAQLRNTTGRTEQEAATALRLADKLERKIDARLAA